MRTYIFHIHKIAILACMIVAIAFSATMAYAVTLPGSGGGSPSQPGGGGGSPTSPSGSVTTLTNPLKVDGKEVSSVSELIFAFVKIVTYLAVIFGVIMLMWVGLQFVMARGKPEEIKKRSNQLLWIVIGIGIVLGARILIEIMINTLQATGTVNPQVIQSAQNAVKSSL